MAGRSRSTFGKRQKEQKRQEKRLEKLARKDERKQQKASGTPVHESYKDERMMPDEAWDEDHAHEEA